MRNYKTNVRLIRNCRVNIPKEVLIRSSNKDEHFYINYAT